MSLTTTVVMISRCSGWLGRSSANRSAIAGGKYPASACWNHGSSGSVESSMCWVSVIFEYATSTAFSGDTSPMPVGLAPRHLGVVGQELQRAVELAGGLEVLHEPPVHRRPAPG